MVEEENKQGDTVEYIGVIRTEGVTGISERGRSGSSGHGVKAWTT